jgi:hypothetical protein
MIGEKDTVDEGIDVKIDGAIDGIRTETLEYPEFPRNTKPAKFQWTFMKSDGIPRK